MGEPDTDFWPPDEPESGHLHRLEHGADKVQASFRRQRADQARPVERRVDGDQDEVERAGESFQRRGIFRTHDVMGAEFLGLVVLGLARGERRDLAAPLVEELQRQVAEAADADDANALRGPHAELADGIEDGDATTEERAGGHWVDARGLRGGPDPVAAHVLREAARPADDGAFAAGEPQIGARTADRGQEPQIGVRFHRSSNRTDRAECFWEVKV